MDPAVAASAGGSGRGALSSGLQGPSTAAQYRWVSLKSAKLFIQSEPIPEEKQYDIDNITRDGVSEERKRELDRIAETLGNDFVGVLDGAGGEDDCIEPILAALSAMDSSQKLCFVKKAGMDSHLGLDRALLDWNVCLKPLPQRGTWDMSFRKKANYGSEDHDSRPSKRRQVDKSPNERLNAPSSGASHPRPPLLGPYDSLIETPRPEVTAAFRHSTVVEASKQYDISEADASDFLEHLELYFLGATITYQNIVEISHKRGGKLLA